jgi:hypothetical protein
MRSGCVALLALVAACTGRSVAEIGSVTVSPPEASIGAGSTQQFTALIVGDAGNAVLWSIVEPNGGSVDTSGLYTAPQTPGTYHIVATNSAQPTQIGSSTITVKAPVSPANISVSMTPTSQSIDACTTATFHATVLGTPDSVVAWSLQEGASAGSITSGGVYTAPSTAGTYHVVATSHADPTASATAAVNVATHVLSVEIAPSVIALQASQQQQFTATITSTCGSFSATHTLTDADLHPRTTP